MTTFDISICYTFKSYGAFDISYLLENNSTILSSLCSFFSVSSALTLLLNLCLLQWHTMFLVTWPSLRVSLRNSLVSLFVCCILQFVFKGKSPFLWCPLGSYFWLVWLFSSFGWTVCSSYEDSFSVCFFWSVCPYVYLFGGVCVWAGGYLEFFFKYKLAGVWTLDFKEIFVELSMQVDGSCMQWWECCHD